MPANQKLYYLKNTDIDKQLWDDCISNAENGLIYATSFYLDGLCKWDAIVLNNYEAVMPLPYRRKYTFDYVYVPAFVQQLGLFYLNDVGIKELPAMLRLAESKFKFGEYYLNNKNNLPILQTKTNFILDLKKRFSDIQNNYKNVLIKNLRKAGNLQMIYKKSDDYRNAVNVCRLTYASQISSVTTADYDRLIETCKILFQKNNLIIREAKDADDNLLSVVLCLKDKNRIYLLLSVTPEAGRKMQANHFLLDNIIKEYSSQDLIFDFEGSDIPGIASLYESFGAINQPYFFYRWNNLPWPANIIKGK